jgi:hypothetical protein
MWRYVLLLVLDLSLYARVNYLQGTDSGPQAHLRRGNEPVGGAIISYLLLVVVELSESLVVQGPEKKLHVVPGRSRGGSPGGGVGGPSAPTTYVDDVDGGPLGVVPEIRERPSPMLKTSMTAPLGGDAGDSGAHTTYLEDVNGGPLGGDVEGLGAPTTYLEYVDGEPLRRRYRMPGNAHHLS